MAGELSRAELLSRGAKTGAALLVAGAAVTALAPVAKADPLSDNDLAFARLLVGAELLGIDFYTRAAAAKKLSPDGQEELNAALFNEQEHYQSVAQILSGAGLVPLAASDVDFTYPKDALATADSIVKLATELEATLLGAYLGAAAGMQSANLVGAIARIAANEAQHLSVFQGLQFGRPINVSFPPALTIEQASDAMAAYTS